MIRTPSFRSWLGILVLGSAAAAPTLRWAQADEPAASLDLMTREGVAAVAAEWRYSDARIVDVMHRAPDAQGQPTGAPVETQDLVPRAGGRDFDDSMWMRVEPAALAARRGNGRLSFGWYRATLTVPARIGPFDPTGSTAVFETVVDDYAEIWVDGEIARSPGQRGGSVIAGWNAPNRVVVGRDVRPGQRFQIAVFAANGPLSDAPANFIWMRSARLDFEPGVGPSDPRAIPPQEVNVEVERRDAELDAIVPANPKLFKLAEGFQFTEGPVWIRDNPALCGADARSCLLFSDPNANRIYRYDPRGPGAISVFREQSGYDGADVGEYRQPGSNGLAVDARGRLAIDEHGRRRIVRLERDGRAVVLVDRYEGSRLNSPNDLVYRSDGTLYFTDPPFGLPRFFEDPRKELGFSGVYAWKDGTLRLLSRELEGPNGLAFSPDERFLYVTNWDLKRKVVLRFPVAKDGSLGPSETFFDMTAAPGEEALDGIKVDPNGHLFVSGPGGVWILSPDGRHLGTIRGPRLPANLAWGDDGRTLYLTARSALYRMQLSTGPIAASR